MQPQVYRTLDMLTTLVLYIFAFPFIKTFPEDKIYLHLFPCLVLRAFYPLFSLLIPKRTLQCFLLFTS